MQVDTSYFFASMLMRLPRQIIAFGIRINFFLQRTAGHVSMFIVGMLVGGIGVNHGEFFRRQNKQRILFSIPLPRCFSFLKELHKRS